MTENASRLGPYPITGLGLRPVPILVPVTSGPNHLSQSWSQSFLVPIIWSRSRGLVPDLVPDIIWSRSWFRSQSWSWSRSWTKAGPGPLFRSCSHNICCPVLGPGTGPSQICLSCHTTKYDKRVPLCYSKSTLHGVIKLPS